MYFSQFANTPVVIMRAPQCLGCCSCPRTTLWQTMDFRFVDELCLVPDYKRDQCPLSKSTGSCIHQPINKDWRHCIHRRHLLDTLVVLFGCTWNYTFLHVRQRRNETSLTGFLVTFIWSMLFKLCTQCSVSVSGDHCLITHDINLYWHKLNLYFQFIRYTSLSF